MDKNDVEWLLSGLLENSEERPKVRSFSDAGLLTTDIGLVLKFSDGSEFQLTIVQSREPAKETE